MEEKKIKIYNAVDGEYYRFHYHKGYVVGKSQGSYNCYYGLKTDEIYDEGVLWLEYPCFSAADYCTPAPDDEILWLEHCVKEGKLFSKATFLAKYYVKTGDVSNYSIF